MALSNALWKGKVIGAMDIDMLETQWSEPFHLATAVANTPHPAPRQVGYPREEFAGSRFVRQYQAAASDGLRGLPPGGTVPTLAQARQRAESGWKRLAEDSTGPAVADGFQPDAPTSECDCSSGKAFPGTRQDSDEREQALALIRLFRQVPLAGILGEKCWNSYFGKIY